MFIYVPLQKERDLELAARIGQSLLKQNQELSARNEMLDEQLQIAKEEVQTNLETQPHWNIKYVWCLYVLLNSSNTRFLFCDRLLNFAMSCRCEMTFFSFMRALRRLRMLSHTHREFNRTHAVCRSRNVPLKCFYNLNKLRLCIVFDIWYINTYIYNYDIYVFLKNIYTSKIHYILYNIIYALVWSALPPWLCQSDLKILNS